MSREYAIYGKDNIEQGALDQMNNVMSLPVVTAGALMPDAHQGYGMPIGGVCAVENAVIPYAVGVDIGCRMMMTVFVDTDYRLLNDKFSLSYRLQRQALKDSTFFGGYSCPESKNNHKIMDDPRWSLLDELKIDKFNGQSLKVEFGQYTTTSDSANQPSEDASNSCIALMSHSGSRALGHTIATFFTKLASELNPLPKPINELSWLSMDSHEGQLYYKLMELCGDYSAANHECIHKAVATSAGLEYERKQVIANHHNYAWIETVNGKSMYVHRKGATPAQKGTVGIIPSSMATKAYIVIGNGNEESLCSASHGSGRSMSRSQALKTIKKEERDNLLVENKVELLGAGLDESPQAYKNIESVMGYQKDLVTKIAEFQPRIVRMAGAMEKDNTEGS
jgi:tRNA-splicing ligase RtcB